MGWSGVFFGRDLAVDLGSANTRVYVRGEGVVLSEPSLVTVDLRSGAMVGCGLGAREMLGRAPENLAVSHPIRGGIITDYEATADMLRTFVSQAHSQRSLARPRVILSVPTALTGIERRAVEDAGYAAGARRVYLIEEAMAAAVGMGLPIHEPAGTMVVSIGAGTTEVAVISLGGIVASSSVGSAGLSIDAAVAEYVRREYSLVLGERTTERLKHTIGSAFPSKEEPEAEVRGRDLVTGLPKNIVITAAEIREAIDPEIVAIVRAIRSTLDRTPPELAGDIMDRGIVLSGGSAALHGLARRLHHETRIRVHCGTAPAEAVVLGAGRCLEDFNALAPLLRNQPRR
ncbi:MAG: rod shape-determining protein [Actinobacteria bacterium]|nr:rod shape-determining protein [Actinomycetota bacterium]